MSKAVDELANEMNDYVEALMRAKGRKPERILVTPEQYKTWTRGRAPTFKGVPIVVAPAS